MRRSISVAMSSPMYQWVARARRPARGARAECGLGLLHALGQLTDLLRGRGVALAVEERGGDLQILRGRRALVEADPRHAPVHVGLGQVGLVANRLVVLRDGARGVTLFERRQPEIVVD